MRNKQTILVLVIIEILVSFAGSAFGVLPPPFITPPCDTDLAGNSTGRDSGGFLPCISEGYTHLVCWLGTNGTPGSLTLKFSAPFTDGAGNDFAILTGGEGWGELADQVEFKFYRANTFIDSFKASLGPNALFAFDLSGSGMVADQIVITNITPDPPGVNNLADMEFCDAGVAYTIPQPATLLLLGLGAAIAPRKQK